MLRLEWEYALPAFFKYVRQFVNNLNFHRLFWQQVIFTTTLTGGKSVQCELK